MGQAFSDDSVYLFYNSRIGPEMTDVVSVKFDRGGQLNAEIPSFVRHEKTIRVSQIHSRRIIRNFQQVNVVLNAILPQLYDNLS